LAKSVSILWLTGRNENYFTFERQQQKVIRERVNSNQQTLTVNRGTYEERHTGDNNDVAVAWRP